jgi:hypothetical protein
MFIINDNVYPSLLIFGPFNKLFRVGQLKLPAITAGKLALGDYMNPFWGY